MSEEEANNTTVNDGSDATGEGTNVEQQREDAPSPSRRDDLDEQNERNGRDERRDSLDSPVRRDFRDRSPARYSGHKRDRYGNHRGRNNGRDFYGRDSPSQRRRRSPSPHDRRNSYRNYDRRPRRPNYDRDRRDDWNRDDRPTKSRRLNSSRDQMESEPLSYTQWCQQRNVSPGGDGSGDGDDDLQKKYEQYVNDWRQKKLRSFFDHYQRTTWFQERYSPESMLEAWKEKCAASKARAADFLSKLDAGTLSCNYSAKGNATIIAEHEAEVSVAAQAKEERQKSNQNRNKRDRRSENAAPESNNDKEEGNADETKDDAKDGDEEVGASAEVPENDGEADKQKPTKEAPKVIVCKSIPLSCSKKSLVDILSEVKGGSLEKFIISQPDPAKGMDRTAWAIYDSNSAASSALDRHHRRNCDNFELVLAFQTLPCHIKRVQFAHPYCNAVERLEKDYKQALRLMQRLDEDYGIEENPLAQEKEHITKEPAQLEQELDMIIGYLRQVHGYCYYAGREFSDPDLLVYQMGRAYLRPVQEEGETCTEGDDSLTAIDKRIQERIESAIKPDLFSSETLETEKIDAFMKANITEETPGEKYRCTLCSKLFKGYNYVIKHIKLKHADRVDQVRKEAQDEQCFVNYKAHADHLENIVAASERRNDSYRRRDSWEDRGRRRSYGGPRRRQRNRYRDHPYDPRDRPPPRGAGRDPRQVMSYVDLDEPKAQQVEIDYGALLSKHAASKKASE